ncbi:amidase domain-containing protein [Ectobacillus polymachus]|uniref:amidase domain-containing protein n=1 Tax=Ectobacillus polymachus TaxID=1508806 RepID=UPI003A85302E
MNVKDQLRALMQKFLKTVTGNDESEDMPADLLAIVKRRKEVMQERNAEVVKCNVVVTAVRELTVGDRKEIQYSLHIQYFIKQNTLMYVEEEKMDRILILGNFLPIIDKFLHQPEMEVPSEELNREITKGKQPYNYNRLEAVKYAEAWWNGRNPAYKNFQDNCTNYISQCLRAGEVPMKGYPNVGSGWWQSQNQWSYSWAVAHSFHGYLSRNTQGLRARIVETAEELKLGDIIIYDFENDGRWNHTTIVTAKDANGMPLVNAHSADSRRRYWAYKDSSKYTPRMKYKFFHIIDNM